jgi:hypothetical protein
MNIQHSPAHLLGLRLKSIEKKVPAFLNPLTRSARDMKVTSQTCLVTNSKRSKLSIRDTVLKKRSIVISW